MKSLKMLLYGCWEQKVSFQKGFLEAEATVFQSSANF